MRTECYNTDQSSTPISKMRRLLLHPDDASHGAGLSRHHWGKLQTKGLTKRLNQPGYHIWLDLPDGGGGDEEHPALEPAQTI